MPINKLLKLVLCFLIFLFSCEKDENTLSLHSKEINGRDGRTLYRIKMPSSWARKQPIVDASLTDTKNPIDEFLIPYHDGQNIKITLHNFPVDHSSSHIPFNAQIARWKRQFHELDLTTVKVQPQSFSGFVGFLFEGNGIISDEQVKMLAWTLQIAPEHEVSAQTSGYGPTFSDVTIKAIGPAEAMEKHTAEIIHFARSFELIKDFPSS